ncbi:alpha-D-ribose 1-methylphosphonate 5-triphosphate synthase subunit PhnG [Bhargavaea ginsengi]|uniref:Alpha-D-ribose 1-methylphosphonate 5-triphosphate synthase subunit PhnG n=1 Tax=Bhargavaea ginsengi TaxID=426757 RepID=A0A1H6Z9S0_9BACL|nr:phosphonate C-P lyase system protein PhnG [Bhargavaea ginsengi]SEJ46412.1 alpha-D-ribose 1-methylphosphonate 5-triphosphate synthase subunit PhnG [Bhargavaea ginsengi]
MKRRRMTEILIEGNPELADRLASEIRHHYPVRELAAPRQGLTMIKMRETAKQSLFYLGEVLVTEAKVEIGDHIGVGIVAGVREKLAGDLAVIDAACRAGLSETAGWTAMLEAEEIRLADRKHRELAALEKTKVQFDTMEE